MTVQAELIQMEKDRSDKEFDSMIEFIFHKMEDKIDGMLTFGFKEVDLPEHDGKGITVQPIFQKVNAVRLMAVFNVVTDMLSQELSEKDFLELMTSVLEGIIKRRMHKAGA